jgi:hypothetical protein
MRVIIRKNTAFTAMSQFTRFALTFPEVHQEESVWPVFACYSFNQRFYPEFGGRYQSATGLTRM